MIDLLRGLFGSSPASSAGLRDVVVGASSSDEVLRVEGVKKTYGAGPTAVDVLHGIDLTLRAGEVTLVMGPSGSGKTTLISILGLLLRPTSGRVFVGGQDVTDLTEAALPLVRRQRVAFVFQGFNLFESLTARENVEMGLSLAGLRGDALRARAEELLAQVGLGDRGHHVPQDLSGGQKQRVAIARALGAPGRVLLADEPTGALDSQNGARVMELLRGAADSGKAVIVVTHDPRLVSLADRVVHIEDGRIHQDQRTGRLGKAASILRSIERPAVTRGADDLTPVLELQEVSRG
jgi:putative ABC transport system ATP-binding protein